MKIDVVPSGKYILFTKLALLVITLKKVSVKCVIVNNIGSDVINKCNR